MKRSIALHEPVIYVSANYRVNGMETFNFPSEILADMCLAFGFLGGKEVKEAGIANAGLHDRESYNRFLT